MTDDPVSQAEYVVSDVLREVEQGDVYGLATARQIVDRLRAYGLLNTEFIETNLRAHPSPSKRHWMSPHDKSSLHMSGCWTLYVRKDTLPEGWIL